MFMEPMEEILAQDSTTRAGNNARTDLTGLYRLKDGDIIITLASDERWERPFPMRMISSITPDMRRASTVPRLSQTSARPFKRSSRT